MDITFKSSSISQEESYSKVIKSSLQEQSNEQAGDVLPFPLSSITPPVNGRLVVDHNCSIFGHKLRSGRSQWSIFWSPAQMWSTTTFYKGALPFRNKEMGHILNLTQVFPNLSNFYEILEIFFWPVPLDMDQILLNWNELRPIWKLRDFRSFGV